MNSFKILYYRDYSMLTSFLSVTSHRSSQLSDLGFVRLFVPLILLFCCVIYSLTWPSFTSISFSLSSEFSFLLGVFSYHIYKTFLFLFDSCSFSAPIPLKYLFFSHSLPRIFSSFNWCVKYLQIYCPAFIII